VAVALAVLCGGCPGVVTPPVDPLPTIRLLFAGDVMLGRKVAPVANADPEGLFRDVRLVVRSADLAFANLESPLTRRPHISTNPYRLEADPDLAPLLAAAGFDVLGIANNHAGDAGPESVFDTITAVEAAGLMAVGGGRDWEAAWHPLQVEVGGLSVAAMAFDLTGQGLAAGPTTPGIVAWEEDAARRTVIAARARADLVVVGVHGGLEYSEHPDPRVEAVADLLVSWGVDVVWGHGPHVAQPVRVEKGARPAVVATSLGNFLFDQRTPATSRGLVLEVLADPRGVVAFRVGWKHHDDLRVHFCGWDPPEGDAALVHGGWWQLARPPEIIPAETIPDLDRRFPYGDVVAVARGDVTGDGTSDLLVSYRHPARHPLLPVDSSGRSAHLGVLATDLTPIWLSRRPPHPVGALAACDGSAAFGYTTLDEPPVVAAGGGVWNGFGFTLADELPGPATVGCADVDGDGRLDPIVLRLRHG
jgi:hypothetical protein